MKFRVILIIGLVLSISVVQAQDSTLVEEEVIFESSDITLAGTLTLPEGEPPYPAVILVSGSGEQNRDGEVAGFMPGYSPSRFLAEGLAPAGFAVLRYDERGIGQSAGEHISSSSADFADDMEAAVDYLLSREDIDATRIGLIGHSEGANIVAMLTARSPHVAFAVSLAGQAVNGYDLLVAQTIAGAEAGGASPEEVEAALAMGRTEWDMVLNEEWAALDAYSREIFAAMPEGQRPTADVQDALIAQQEVFAKNWFSFFLQYDPAEDWAKVDVPVLAIFAELDTQVPLEQNLPALESAVEEKDNFTLVVLEQTNHLFQPGAETGAPEEYIILESAFTPELLPTISDWLAEHVN